MRFRTRIKKSDPVIRIRSTALDPRKNWNFSLLRYLLGALADDFGANILLAPEAYYVRYSIYKYGTGRRREFLK